MSEEPEGTKATEPESMAQELTEPESMAQESTEEAAATLTAEPAEQEVIDGRPNCTETCGDDHEYACSLIAGHKWKHQAKDPATGGVYLWDSLPPPTDAPAPRDVPLPFPVPPFDAERALERIEAKDRNVQALSDEYESLKKHASAAKKEWEEGVAELHELIVGLRDQRKDADRQQAQPLLAFVADGAQRHAAEIPDAGKPGCKFERETGSACPICREHPLTGDNANFAETDAHVEAAVDLDELEFMQARLEAVGLYLSLVDVKFITADHTGFAEVESWASALHISKTSDSSVTVPVQPDYICPHEAAEPGDDFQACRLCGSTLYNYMEMPTREPYPVGAWVGIDCPGEPREEASRPVAKRGAKKGRRKHDPDAIAKDQASAVGNDQAAYNPPEPALLA